MVRHGTDTVNQTIWWHSIMICWYPTVRYETDIVSPTIGYDGWVAFNGDFLVLYDDSMRC